MSPTLQNFEDKLALALEQQAQGMSWQDIVSHFSDPQEKQEVLALLSLATQLKETREHLNPEPALLHTILEATLSRAPGVVTNPKTARFPYTQLKTAKKITYRPMPLKMWLQNVTNTLMNKRSLVFAGSALVVIVVITFSVLSAQKKASFMAQQPTPAEEEGLVTGQPRETALSLGVTSQTESSAQTKPEPANAASKSDSSGTSPKSNSSPSSVESSIDTLLAMENGETALIDEDASSTLDKEASDINTLTQTYAEPTF